MTSGETFLGNLFLESDTVRSAVSARSLHTDSSGTDGTFSYSLSDLLFPKGGTFAIALCHTYPVRDRIARPLRELSSLPCELEISRTTPDQGIHQLASPFVSSRARSLPGIVDCHPIQPPGPPVLPSSAFTRGKAKLPRLKVQDPDSEDEAQYTAEDVSEDGSDHAAGKQAGTPPFTQVQKLAETPTGAGKNNGEVGGGSRFTSPSGTPVIVPVLNFAQLAEPSLPSLMELKLFPKASVAGSKVPVPSPKPSSAAKLPPIRSPSATSTSPTPLTTTTKPTTTTTTTATTAAATAATTTTTTTTTTKTARSARTTARSAKTTARSNWSSKSLPDKEDAIDAVLVVLKKQRRRNFCANEYLASIGVVEEVPPTQDEVAAAGWDKIRGALKKSTKSRALDKAEMQVLFDAYGLSQYVQGMF